MQLRAGCGQTTQSPNGISVSLKNYFKACLRRLICSLFSEVNLMVLMYLVQLKQILHKHSHKKWKDSLERWAVLLTFCLNLKYLGWPYRAYIKTSQNGDFWEELLSENELRLFQPLSVVMTIVPRLLRQFRRLLQIKKGIANASRVL